MIELENVYLVQRRTHDISWTTIFVYRSEENATICANKQALVPGDDIRVRAMLVFP